MVYYVCSHYRSHTPLPIFYRLSGADCGIGQRSCKRGKFLLKTVYAAIELDLTFGDIRLFSICRQNFSCSVDICKQMEEQAAVNLLTKELRQVEHSLDNIIAAIEKGIVSLTTNKRLHELETRQQELEKQIKIEKARCIVILSKAELRTYYKEALLLEGKMLINYMVKEITLYNDRVVITFNSPLRTSPDDSQDFSFYEEETYMDVVMRNRGTVERHNQLLILAV